MVVFDSTFLLLLLDDKTSVPRDPATDKPWKDGRARIEYLIDRLSDAGTEVLIPTPVLAEVLVRTGTATAQILAQIRATKGLRIVDFDQRAAIEVALMTGAALVAGKKRGKAAAAAPWQKVKIDRQIVAIAKAHCATEIFTSDQDLSALAIAEGLRVSDIGDLSSLPVNSQQDMFGEIAEGKR